MSIHYETTAFYRCSEAWMPNTLSMAASARSGAILDLEVVSWEG